MEIGRHLVEQDQDWTSTLEQFEPVLLVRGLRASRPESAEFVALSKLFGDLTPEEVIRVVAAIEGRDGGAFERVGVRYARGELPSQRRVLGQETKADEQVRLAATHGLLEVEHRLRRRTGEARDTLAD